MNGMAASDKIFKILDLPEPQAGEKTLPDGALDVTLKDVHFSYEENREILKGIGLNLPAGSFVSLVGESGCGKSTIAGILAAKNRGYKGEITIGGVPLNEVNETNLMQRVVLVRHNSYLFKGTVEENLKMAKPDATKEEMEAVLQKVNLLGFLQTQDGLQTQLLEKASNLSGGQCQRLVIARALLRTDSAVYIFDEAVSNIDVESEELIMNVIHELAKTKTVLLISHRLANVVKSDKIYFLKDGEIKESGKHDELMSQNGAYRHLDHGKPDWSGKTPAPYHAGSNHPWNIRLLMRNLSDDTGRTGYRAWTSDRGSRNDCSGGQYVAGIYPGKNNYHSYDRHCSASWNPALCGTVL